jgi:hypothetical protein
MKINWWPVVLLGLVTVFCTSVGVQAATVSWWRFEAGQDTNPSATGFSNPNEVSGGQAMVSSNATLGTNTPDLFAAVVPGPNVPNTGSVRSAVNGASTDGIFGSAGYDSVLNVNSITVEFWMRTTESEAGFVARTTNSANSGESGSLTDGFRIVDPENVRVEYYTSNNGGGNVTLRTMTSGVAVNDGEWHYIAFTYDYATGVGKLYIDDVNNPVEERNDNNNRRLYWGNNSAQPGVHIGYRMDGDPNNQTGTLDEIRFTNLALPPSELLIVPEASQMVALVTLLGLITFGTLRARRRSLTTGS